MEHGDAMSEGTVSLVRGRWVVAGAGEAVVEDGAVVVRDATVVEVGAWAEVRPRFPRVEVLGSTHHAVLPGLINAHHHSHGVSAAQHGLGDDLLEPWILAWRRMRPSDRHLETLLACAAQLRGGVTTAVDVLRAGGSAEIYRAELDTALRAHREAGGRVALAAGMATQSLLVHGAGEDERFVASLPPDARPHAQRLLEGTRPSEDEYFAILGEVHASLAGDPRIELWFGPPGPQWVSDRFMQRIAEHAEAWDTNIQTHVDESFYEKLHGERGYRRPTVLHLEALGVLGPRFSIAHGTWLTREEIAALARTGAAVSHNPGSNLRLRAGVAPLNALLEAGVTTALGMDGTTLDDDEDMLAEMRLALRLHRTPTLGGPAPAPVDVLAMATTGGARLMRAGHRLGRLAPGYAADLLLLDLDRITWPWVAPECDPVELLLMRAAARDIAMVMVGGEVVMRDGQPTRFDLRAAGEALAERLRATPPPPGMAEAVATLTPYLEAWYRSWETPRLEPWAVMSSQI